MTNEEENLLKSVYDGVNSLVSELPQSKLKEMCLHHFKTTGKGARPKLAIELAQVFDIDLISVIDWATGIEILHNATLIHDDLQDGDMHRRGAETVWSKFGEKQAINAGDFLLKLSTYSLSSIVKVKVQADLQTLLAKTAMEIVAGQSLEFEIPHMELDSLEQNYFRCIKGKTASLFGATAEGVAICGQFDKNQKDTLFNIFEKVGVLFQIQDDILDLYGDKQRLERGCDIREGKFSSLVVAHLSLRPVDNELVREILLKKRELTTCSEVDFLVDTFQSSGALESCISYISKTEAEIRDDASKFKNIRFSKLVNNYLEFILRPINHLLETKEVAVVR